MGCQRQQDRTDPDQGLRRTLTLAADPGLFDRAPGTRLVLVPGAPPVRSVVASLEQDGRTQRPPATLTARPVLSCLADEANHRRTAPRPGPLPDHIADEERQIQRFRWSGTRMTCTTSRRRTSWCRTRRRSWASSRHRERAPDQARCPSGALLCAWLSGKSRCDSPSSPLRRIVGLEPAAATPHSPDSSTATRPSAQGSRPAGSRKRVKPTTCWKPTRGLWREGLA